MSVRLAASFVSALLCVAALSAQEKLEVQGPTPGVVRLGEAAQVQITIEGRGADPRAPKLPLVEGLNLELSSPTRSSYTFFDGRTMVRRQGVQYRLLLRPERTGEFVIPSFPIWTGTKEQAVPEMRLQVVRDLEGQNVAWIEVGVRPRRVYVHEPIRIHVEFGIQAGLRLLQDTFQRTRYLDIEVQAPWLKDFPGGEPIDLEPPSGDLRTIIGNRELLRARYDGRYERDGKTWQRFSFDRAFLPTRTGTTELPAPTLRFHVVSDTGRRDIFGQPRLKSENLYAYGTSVSVEVLPIPEEGRPTPFYGAVGRFRIEAALDRDRVRLGDSVTLELTVTGQGNLEFLRMPEVDDLEGFHKLGEAEVRRAADKVVVHYDLTPLREDITELPPIAWNYFDTTPGVERFVEVKTPPLPLKVEPAPEGEALPSLAPRADRAVTPGKDDIFDLPDLGGPPLRRPASDSRWAWFAVLGPWFAVALFVLGYRTLRRRLSDVSGRRARSAARRCRRALAEGGDAVEALAGYLADRLDVPPPAVIRPDLAAKLEQAGVEAGMAREVADTIERGMATRFGGGEALTAAEVEALVDRLEPATLRRGSFLGLLLLPFLLGASAPVAVAQQPSVEEAVALYRSGDYVAADAAFASLYERTGDRRLLQARGNCLFRLGDLPRALWAYESARLAKPRDPQLLADIRLTRSRLGIPPREEGLVAELGGLQRSLLPSERRLAIAVCMLVAALCLLLGWRSPGLRWIGAFALVPGVFLAIEECWLAPNRPPRAIALDRIAITSEPRGDQEPVATVRPGVTLDVLGGTSGAFARVRAGDRAGYAPSAKLAVIE